MTPPTLVVMAAGMGSRYGGLKQIDPIGPCGEVVLDYSVFDAIRSGFGKVVFIIRKDIEADFKAAVGGHFEGRIPVEYVFQDIADLPPGFAVPAGRSKPWGTSHAILCAAHAVREPFAVINADDFYGRRSFEVLAGQLAAMEDRTGVYTLVGFILEKTLSAHGGVSRGVCRVDDRGFLTDIEECHEIRRQGDAVVLQRASGPDAATGREAVSMNMWGFTPDFFTHLRSRFPAFLGGMKDPLKSEFLVPTTVNELVHEGAVRVQVVQSPEQWYGVTYPADKAAVSAGVRSLIDDGDYPPSLWS